MNRKALFAGACALLAAGFLLAGVVYKKHRAAKLGFLARSDIKTFIRPHSPAFGAEGAKVFVVEFTDPACETCAAFAPILKRIIAANPGKVDLIIRYAPFHQGASDFVRILEASKKQDKYWKTYELLLETQPLWAVHHQAVLERAWPLLPRAGLDVERLKRDMYSEEITRVIETDLADAETLGVRKTPGIFVNGKPLEPFGVEPLMRLVHEAIRERYPD